MHLPYMLEKCCYKGVEGVRVYEQMLKIGLRFPLSSLHCRLFQYLGVAVTQISLNAWKVFLGVDVGDLLVSVVGLQPRRRKAVGQLRELILDLGARGQVAQLPHVHRMIPLGRRPVLDRKSVV